MARRWLLRLVIPVLACSACADDAVPSGEGTGSGTGGMQTGTSTSSSLTMTQTSTPSTTVEPDSSTASLDSSTGTESDTSAGEECVSGTWEGTYYYGFEVSAFYPCEGGPPGDWWVEDGPAIACEAIQVSVSGTVCGPGEYGHASFYRYLFNGSVSAEGCLPGSCDAEPELCGPIDQLCASECSLVRQDCFEGEKCVPHDLDGMLPWNETVCVPLLREPVGPGEACMRSGPNDDCAQGWWCIPDVLNSDTGVCVELCTAETTCTEGECSPCSADEAVAFGVCVPPSCMGEPGCPGAC